MRLGIFGGTFNPIHLGHLRAAEEVRFKAELDRVIFIPSGNPPLKFEDMVDASHRYNMVGIAISTNPFFVVSDIEVAEKEKSYTVNTVQRLRELYPKDELFFILGVDAFLDLPNWWQPYRLISMIDFIIVTRPNFAFSDIVLKSPFIKADTLDILDDQDSISLVSDREARLIKVTEMDISSTEIRKLLKERKSIKYLLPESVEDYICRHGLYIN